MESLQHYVELYQEQLEAGNIQRAYKGLMTYMANLKTHFAKIHPGFFVSSHIYQGTMDISFFSVMPQTLKHRKLKIVVLLVHEAMEFEVWLCGYNKSIQKNYWQVFQNHGWTQYDIPTDGSDLHYIVRHTLVGQPNFDDLEALTHQIEVNTLEFMAQVIEFLDDIR